MPKTSTRTTAEKVAIFRRFFAGLSHVYGTYDVRTGRARQVKEPVTDDVILAHLQGRNPYGVYLLNKDHTRAVAADFDADDPRPPMEFVSGAKHYGIAAFIERSKSKGYHVWIFFEEKGVPAIKARTVVRHILKETEKPMTEVFPKQDSLDTNVTYGNFINAPLFGTLVPQGRTVFVDSNAPAKPYADQWELLESIEPVPERLLDDVIEINELTPPSVHATPPARRSSDRRCSFGLPPCVQTMLAEGVTEHQRVSCFRLAVQLKRAGLPFDSAVAVLCDWAPRNRPSSGKRIITDAEITAQAACAYDKDYRACGCEDPAVTPHCDPGCTVSGQNRNQPNRAAPPAPPVHHQPTTARR